MQRIASIIISIYIAIIIYTEAFFIKTLTITQSAPELFWNHLGIFMIILVPVFFLVKNVISLPHPRSHVRFLRSALLSLALLGLVLSLLYHVVPVEPVYDLPAFLDKIFSSDLAYTLWLVAPLLVLVV